MANDATQKIITLQDVRLSYAFLFNPMIGTDDKGNTTRNFCTHAIMAPNHPGIALLKAAQKEVAQAKWGAQALAIMQSLSGQDKLALHSGNISKPGQEGYEGNFYVSANSKQRPTLVETRGGVNVQLVESDGRPYSGCFANVMVAVYAQDPKGEKAKFGKRINAQLMGVQFLRHGDAFGGGRVAKPEEFGITAEGADGAAPGEVAMDFDAPGSDLI